MQRQQNSTIADIKNIFSSRDLNYILSISFLGKKIDQITFLVI